ncbi:hypothetical protein LRY29_00575 [Candidatus Saccharibacteria bacterium]|nr:hypothetical protein [Candidatus Saccharibacteria bacterium]
MRRRVILTCLILSGLIILDSLNAGHALVMFLLAGIIPGTSIAISGGQMLALFALAAGIVVGRIFSRSLRSYRPQAQA